MSASALARASATTRVNSRPSTRGVATRRGEACVRRARITPKEPWWEKNTAANMVDCEGVEAFLTLLNDHSDKLIVVDVYAQWCGACRALYPKLCKIAAAYPDVVFVKLNFDDNKDLCRSLGVKVLPYFKLYRGTEGCVAQFSASIAKIKLLRAALEEHSPARCALHEGETVHYEDLDGLAEYEALTDEKRKEAEPSPVP